MSHAEPFASHFSRRMPRPRIVTRGLIAVALLTISFLYAQAIWGAKAQQASQPDPSGRQPQEQAGANSDARGTAADTGASGTAADTGESARANSGEPWHWYRGNLHTHTLWSDGNDFPEMVVRWYRENGYQFLALSDHNVLSEGIRWIDVNEPEKRGAIGGFQRYQDTFGQDWVETRTSQGKQEVRLKSLQEFRPRFEEEEKFLLVQAEEITDSFESLPIHVNASNLVEMIRPQGGKSLRETIRNNFLAIENQKQQTNRPILGHLNHPNFDYAVSAEDLADVLPEKFFEVYNGHPDVHHLGDAQHLPVETMWDIANTIRIDQMRVMPLFGLATDDSHNYFGNRGASTGRGWVVVRASRLTPESLIASLEAGDFYASSGVALQAITIDEQKRILRVAIDTSSHPAARYTTRFLGTRKDFDRSREEMPGDPKSKRSPRYRYSADIGQVLASVEGSVAEYEFQGDELYVRAVITSDQPAENPSFDGQKQQAWTQPVGWQFWLEPGRLPESAPPFETK